MRDQSHRETKITISIPSWERALEGGNLGSPIFPLRLLLFHTFVSCQDLVVKVHRASASYSSGESSSNLIMEG